jgi:FixJ family two-component response regulator
VASPDILNNRSDARVIIVDDDPDVRTSLVALLQSVGVAAQTYASVPELLASGSSMSHASCLILDVRLPGRSGLDWYEEIHRAGDGLPVIFISGHADIPMSVRAMKAGAFEFLTKPFRAQDLIDALQRAIERGEARQKEREHLESLRTRFGDLSGREREVMALAVSGMTNKRIGAQMGLTEATIKLHRGRAMLKMRASCIADLVRMADKLGIDAHLR